MFPASPTRDLLVMHCHPKSRASLSDKVQKMGSFGDKAIKIGVIQVKLCLTVPFSNVGLYLGLWVIKKK